MNWLEVSMTVDGELAESVADVFARFAPNGVMTEQGVKYNDAEDAGTPTDRSQSAHIWKQTINWKRRAKSWKSRFSIWG